MKGASVSFFIAFVLMVNLQNTESRKMSMDEVNEALLPLKKICIERVRLDPKVLDKVNKGNFVSDRKLQCYYKCMLLNTKGMSKDDRIVKQALVNIVELMLNDNLFDPSMKALEHCDPIIKKKGDGCELAYELIKCIYEFDSMLLFFS
ncbi:general odorant-binding protein 72-like [Nylanderia fulva]|uniref:general odorant-binding protein 72-like n=1 Tax=Nylanderia fulva TaxID=613905 RepID=UPI0010FBA8CB|nr:general odorant-binding protein 72-like [Nylanderia fulva]